MTLEAAARAAGATVLGEDGTTQHFMLTLEQMARMVALLQSPAPLPPPY